MSDTDSNPAEDAMAQMMGFSSFGGQKRKKPKHDHDNDAGGLSQKPPSTSSNSMPLGNRSLHRVQPNTPTVTSQVGANPDLPTRPFVDSIQPHYGDKHTQMRTGELPSTFTIQQQQQHQQRSWTNPHTGKVYTHEELARWSDGVKGPDGVTVYFKPSFVDPDPWAHLKR